MTLFGEIFLWMMSLSLPFVLFLLGAAFWKYPPKTISGSFGYRTRRSKQSQESWEAAQKLSGKYLCILGVLLLIAVPLVLLLTGPASDPYTLLLICVTVEVLLIVLPILAVERHLKMRFPDK